MKVGCALEPLDKTKSEESLVSVSSVQKSLQKPLQVLLQVPLLTAIIQQSYWYCNNFSAKVLVITQTALGFSATGI